VIRHLPRPKKTKPLHLLKQRNPLHPPIHLLTHASTAPHQLIRILIKHNATGYDVLSLGPDGLENTEDDISNW